jgi:hypothetical protein
MGLTFEGGIQIERNIMVCQKLVPSSAGLDDFLDSREKEGLEYWRLCDELTIVPAG